MGLADPAAARWPHLADGRAHYESYYLRAVDPARPRGVWIRYTVSAAPDGPPRGQLWFTFFDRSAPGPRAVRVDAGAATTSAVEWIRLGDSTFGADAIAGTAGDAASWSLRSRNAASPLEHLPRDWMYRARLPRTKLVSLSPSVLFDGVLEVDGESIAVSGWAGMIGHNWGEQHAEQWIWLHGLHFGGPRAGTWLDVALARVRLGPVLSPWIANGALSLDGRRLRLGGLGRRVAVVAADDACTLRIPFRGGAVTASASAPAASFVEWDYAAPDPGHPAHRVINCSIADLEVTVTTRGMPPRELRSTASAAYELGGLGATTASGG